MPTFIRARDIRRRNLVHLQAIDRDRRGRIRQPVNPVAKRDRDFLDFMIAQLGFNDYRLAHVGYHHTTQSFAKYQLMRSVGMSHAQAIERLLYPELYSHNGNGHTGRA